MVDFDSKRTPETRRWKIPDKFINSGFAEFLHNAFPVEEAHMKRDVILITGYNSIDEWAGHYELQEKYGITITSILKLLDDKGCIIELNKKENYLKYHNKNIENLMWEILARISE